MPKKRPYPPGETPIEDIEEWIMRMLEKDPEMILHTGSITEWKAYLDEVGIRYGLAPTPTQMTALWSGLGVRTPKGFDIPLHRDIGIRMVRQFIRGRWTFRFFGYPEKRFIPRDIAMERIEEARRIGLLPRKVKW